MDTFEIYNEARRRLDGWLEPDSVQSLLDLSAGQATGDLLEIGTYRGQSACVMASLLKPGESLYLSDLFTPNRPAGPNYSTYEPLTEEALKAVIEELAGPLRGRLRTVKGPSSELALPGPFRVVHVDGSHAYADARRDIDYGLDRLTADGFVAVDDFRHPVWPEVDRAILSILHGRRDVRVLRYDSKKIYLQRID